MWNYIWLDISSIVLHAEDLWMLEVAAFCGPAVIFRRSIIAAAAVDVHSAKTLDQKLIFYLLWASIVQCVDEVKSIYIVLHIVEVFGQFHHSFHSLRNFIVNWLSIEYATKLAWVRLQQDPKILIIL